MEQPPDFYRQLLEERLAGIYPPRRDGIEVVRDSDVVVNAELAFDRQTAAMELTRQARVVRLVRIALGKIARGEYGFCELCRGPIPEPRLRAVPEARFCMDCLRQRRAA